MSGEDRRTGAPQDSPWSLDLLADYHAGALDPAAADDVRALADGDPEAAEILAALETTRSELGEQPDLSVPDDVAARLEARLADEVAALGAGSDDPAWLEGRVVDLDAARNSARNSTRNATHTGRRKRSPNAREAASRRRFGWSAGLVAAAAVALGVVVGTPLLKPTSGDTQAIEPPMATRPPSETPKLTLHGEQAKLTRKQLQSVLGTEQYGALLSDPERLNGCLRANGITSSNPMGAREITFNGRPAQLLVLPAGEIGKFRLLVVAPRCGAEKPATLSDTTTGS